MGLKPAAPVERTVLSLSALALLSSAGLAARLAAEHMQSAAAFCGAGSVAHCGWCAATVALGLAGVTAFLVAVRPSPPAPVLHEPPNR